MVTENSKIKRSSKFKDIADISNSLPENHGVVIYRPNGSKQFVAFNKSGNFFLPTERQNLDDDLTKAKVIDIAAFMVFRGKSK